jgi:hypothetical protein
MRQDPVGRNGRFNIWENLSDLRFFFRLSVIVPRGIQRPAVGDPLLTET